MYLRLELLGMYLEIGKAEPDKDTPAAPDSAPQPMVVSSEEPTEEIGFKSSAARVRGGLRTVVSGL